jgi:nuclease S1
MRISLLTTAALAITFGALTPAPALPWGDEGREIVALVVQAFLEPDVRSKDTGLLDSLTPHAIASEATLADKFRDANRDGSREKTHLWHFVDIEVNHPDLDGDVRKFVSER